MCMPGFEWTSPIIAVSFSAIGSTQQRKSHGSSCDRAGAKPQGRQFLPQHNAPDCSHNCMEPFGPCRFFIPGRLGTISDMVRTAWPWMLLLPRDVLDLARADMFSYVAWGRC